MTTALSFKLSPWNSTVFLLFFFDVFSCKKGPLLRRNMECDEAVVETLPSNDVDGSRISKNDAQNNNENDKVDARALFFSFGRSKPEEAVGRLSVAIDSLDYNMSHAHRGDCLIFNHRTFLEKTKCRERKGTEIDCKALCDTFRRLGFKVNDLQDPTHSEIQSALTKASEADYTNVDCFICCVLTHGEQGSLWSKDKKYSVDCLFDYFRNCPSLAGKPKIFLIQACQGDKLDAGIKVVTYKDVADNTVYQKIPTWADFLIVHSTVPGYYAWRNTSCGSWFIQSLTSTLNEYAAHLDLLSMLTIVNHKVAYYFESCVPNDEEFDKKKQVSCVTSMLTRRLFFFPQQSAVKESDK